MGLATDFTIEAGRIPFLEWLPNQSPNNVVRGNSPHPTKATLSPHRMRGEGRVRGAGTPSAIGFITEIHFGNCSKIKKTGSDPGLFLDSAMSCYRLTR